MTPLAKGGILAALGTIAVAAISGIAAEFGKSYFFPTTVIVNVPPSPQNPPAPVASAPASLPVASAVPDPVTQTDASAPVAAAIDVALPDVPDTLPPVAPAEYRWTPEVATRLTEQRGHRVCPDGDALLFTVRKSGTRPAAAITVQLPEGAVAITSGQQFELSPACRLRLDRTGKTDVFFAEFTYTGPD